MSQAVHQDLEMLRWGMARNWLGTTGLNETRVVQGGTASKWHNKTSEGCLSLKPDHSGVTRWEEGAQAEDYVLCLRRGGHGVSRKQEGRVSTVRGREQRQRSTGAGVPKAQARNGELKGWL